MNAAPVCPYHQKPMTKSTLPKLAARGAWYCTEIAAPGYPANKKGYCAYTWEPPQQAATTVAAPPMPAQAPAEPPGSTIAPVPDSGATVRLRCALGALQAAGARFAGMNVPDDAVIACAAKMYTFAMQAHFNTLPEEEPLQF